MQRQLPEALPRAGRTRQSSVRGARSPRGTRRGARLTCEGLRRGVELPVRKGSGVEQGPAGGRGLGCQVPWGPERVSHTVPRASAPRGLGALSVPPPPPAQPSPDSLPATFCQTQLLGSRCHQPAHEPFSSYCLIFCWRHFIRTEINGLFCLSNPKAIKHLIK